MNLVGALCLVLSLSTNDGTSSSIAHSPMKSVELKSRPVPLSAVRLLPSRFKEAQEVNGKYLLMLDPYRLLHGFYKNAGLPTKGDGYGGWETMGIAGHSLGHYLSGVALHYAATGDIRFKEKAEIIVRELTRCQNNRKDGYIGAIPDGDRVWNEIRKGEIRSKGFDLNGIWVPSYTQHKVLAGLIDAYRLAGIKEAVPIATNLGDWAIEVTSNLDNAKWQTMLACEHGGMNEVLADLYELSGQSKYLDLARKFHHDAVLKPLEEGVDKLAGLHSNTQIPKLIGLAKLYEIGGEAPDRKGSEFFWDRIVNHRTFSMGGNSNGEYLTTPGRLSDQLSASSAETCNTYNMLKLTKHLHTWDGDAKRYDFYERALYNHILASQRPTDAMKTYFVPLQPMAKRNFSNPYDDFTCCHGTGMENHAKYGEAIYTEAEKELQVNLYIPSSIVDPREDFAVSQSGDYERDQKVTIRVDRAPSSERSLALRVPFWTVGQPKATLNGKSISLKKEADGYARITGTFKPGDEVKVHFPAEIRLEPTPDNPKKTSVLYGPVVLVGIQEEDGEVPAPVFVPKVGADLRKSFQRVKGNSLRFVSKSLIKPKDLTLVPFHEVYDKVYTTYFDVFTDDEWKVREAEYRKAIAAKEALEKATTDLFRVGEMQPERDHDLQGENTGVGEHSGRKWRHAMDGWFSFRMKVDSEADHTFVCDYWSGDFGREFEILVDGVLLSDEKRARPQSPGFVQIKYPLPLTMTQGKQSVVIMFRSKNKSIAGGLYGARMVRNDRLPNP